MPDVRTVKKESIFERIRRRGLRGCLAYIAPANFGHIRNRLSTNIRLFACQWCARCWDRKHGVETWRAVGKDELEGDSDVLDFAVFYAPCAPSPFHKIIQHLSLEPGRYELVDYGSGKGKLLFLASRYPFKKIIGVEFDHRLHQQAVKNLATYKGARRCEDIELLHMDALKYDHPNGPSLLVFYSPFHTELLERVLERIRQGVEKDPRETIICFFDDVVWNSQVPKVHKIVSQWRDWQTEEIYRVKRSWDMLYASEAVISRWTPDNGNIVDV